MAKDNKKEEEEEEKKKVRRRVPKERRKQVMKIIRTKSDSRGPSKLLSEMKALNNKYLYVSENADKEEKSRIKSANRIYSQLRDRFERKYINSGTSVFVEKAPENLIKQFNKLPSIIGETASERKERKNSRSLFELKNKGLGKEYKKQIKSTITPLAKAGGTMRDDPFSIFESHPRPELADKIKKNRGGLLRKSNKDYRKTGMFYGGMVKKK